MPAPSDLVHETSTTTGTGNFTLTNANGKRSFNTAFGNGAPTDVFDYFISNRDAAEWERGTGHLSAASTLVRDTVKASSNAGAAVNFSAGTKDVTNDIPADNQAVLETALPARIPHGMDMPINLGLDVTASGGALTIAIKGGNGSDPSATNRVFVPFRFAGTAGTPVWASITGANSLVLSSGSTLGVTSSTAFRIWVVLFNDAGTYRLGAINCNRGTAGVYPLAEEAMASSTAEGGAGAADSAGVVYTGTAVSSKPYRILGYVEWNTTGLTAGTWTTTNFNVLNGIVLFTPGMKKPGDIVQVGSVTKTDTFTSTSTTFTDITGLTISITPTSAANNVLCFFSAFGMGSTGVNACVLRSMRGATAIAVGDAAGSRTSGSALLQSGANSNSTMTAAWSTYDTPQSAASVTYKTQGLCNAAGTFHINRPEDNTDGAAYVRGTSAITVQEIMA